MMTENIILHNTIMYLYAEEIIFIFNYANISLEEKNINIKISKHHLCNTLT